MLTDPRYTGHEVWNKAAQTGIAHRRGRRRPGPSNPLAWNAKPDWVLSDQPVHDVVITKDTFEQVQARFASRSPRSPRAVVRHTHPYAFKGLVTHAEFFKLNETCECVHGCCIGLLCRSVDPNGVG
ncbi:recombinase family protein [Nocardia sp. NPDC052112]|uniref:recombinase family protein n=1 Tax=Nocardia sp. NPDC052112 TaxID=3155646 RepID=UPI003437FD99